MGKLIFKNDGYTYFDRTNKSREELLDRNFIKSVKYNQKHVDELIANYKYSQAADYMSNYHMNDIDKEREHIATINRYRQQGRQYEGRVKALNDIDPNGVAASKFYDAVFSDGGLESITKNTFKDDFSKSKNKLGSGSSHLSIHFKSKKNTLLGIDWLAKDDKFDGLTQFLKDNNMTESYLRSKGVNIIKNEDGSRDIEFDKTNSLANELLYKTYKQNYVTASGGYGTAIMSNIKGYNIINGKKEYVNKKVDYDDDLSLITMVRTIDNASKYKTKLEEKDPLAKKEYSSVIMDFTDDFIEDLNNRYYRERMKDSDYIRIRDEHIKNIKENFVQDLQVTPHDIYTDYSEDKLKDESITNETMYLADEPTAKWIVQYISGANINDIALSSQESNGIYGTRITVKARTVKDKKQKGTYGVVEEEINYPSISIFVPGLYSESIQKSMDRDTNARAIKETNAMQDYDYEYTLNDGNIINYNGDGTFTLNRVGPWKEKGKTISTDEANALIAVDLGIQDLKSTLIFNHLNVDGKIVNEDNLRKDIQAAAVALANNAYPEIPLTDLDTIFKIKGTGATVARQYRNELDDSTFKKLEKIYSIYEELRRYANEYR